MLTAEDKVLLAGKGITEEQIEAQLQTFKKGFPFLKLKATASLAHGILAPSAEECRHYEEVWKAYKEEGKAISKFVPASGAASRMFKNMCRPLISKKLFLRRFVILHSTMNWMRFA